MDTKILLENGTNELEVLEFTIGENSYGINVQYIIWASVKSDTKFVIVYFTVYVCDP